MKTRKQSLIWFAYCLLIAAACLAVCSKSSFLYPINDWTDANAYFSCGKGMLTGRVIYRDLYEHKGPLLYALHALCCVVNDRTFLAVYFMETLCVALFLLAAMRTLELYGAKRAAFWGLPVVAALVLSSQSFQQGDSAEELCMPMLAWSLFYLLRWVRNRAPHGMRTGELILSGVLCGCVLWVKFTMLGFYLPWIFGMMIYHFRKYDAKAAFRALGWFAAGAAMATVPWVVYFGLNNAIGPWLKTYLYDNLFLYQGEEALGFLARVKAALHSGWDWATLNWAYVVPMAAGFLWLTFHKDKQEQAAVSGSEKAFLWFTAGFLALGVFAGGKSYLYYGLILAVYAPLMLLPLEKPASCVFPGKRALSASVACVMLLGSVGLCFAASPNTPDLLKPREETMQYRFAALVNQTPNATLLNYGFMDAGFYTACHIAPTVKYFHRTNMPLPEMWDEQDRYVREGVTDYVVTRAPLAAKLGDRYTLISTEKSPAGFWYDTVYLYKRKDLD